MSRSCQSATFSRPTTAAVRTTRASPQLRSTTTGLRFRLSAGELQPEGRRLGMDAMGASYLQGAAMLLGARNDGRERPVELLEDERSRRPDLEREGGVDDVGGGQAVVEPAALLAERSGDRVDE